MPRFQNPAVQFFNSAGSTLPGGKLYFYEPNTNTKKDTYSDEALTIQNPNPIVLDSAGRVPDIWLEGNYKVVLTTASGTQIWERDPVGEVSPSNAQDWNIGLSYDFNDLVQGSNDFYYTSIISGNIGNDPTVQPSSTWSEVLFIRPYLDDNTYRQGEPTIASDGRLYQSQVGANQGNDPTSDDGTNWQILLQEDDNIITSDITLTKTNVQTRIISFVNDGFQRWNIEFDASENLNVNKYDGTGAFLLTPISITQAGTIEVDEGTNFNSTVQFLNTASVNFDGLASDASFQIRVDSSQSAEYSFIENGFRRWAIIKDSSNLFNISRYDGAGLLIDKPIEIGSGGSVTMPNNLSVGQDIELTSSEATILADNVAATDLNIDFTNTTGDLAFNVFKTTNSTGARTIDFYKGDGSSTVTVQADAADGSILLAADEGGVKLRKITLDTAAPSGGSDGDVWFRYV